MANEATPKQPWWHDLTKVLLFLTALGTFVNTVQTGCNGWKADRGNDKIDHVITQNDSQLQKTQDIQIELSNVQQKAAVIDHKASVIDSKLKKQ